MQVGLKTSRDLENKLPTLSFIPYQNHSFSSTGAPYPDLFGACEDNRTEFKHFHQTFVIFRQKIIHITMVKYYRERACLNERQDV